MKLDTVRFGQIEIHDDKIIAFPEGIPGFESIRQFIVIETLNTRPIYWLQSIDEPSVALSIINPYEVLKEYSPAILEQDMKELALASPESMLVFTVVVLPEDITTMTANLAAPILINVDKSLGRQILVDAKEYSVRHPIFADVYKLIQKESESIDAGADAQS